MPHLREGDTKASCQSCRAACVGLGVNFTLLVPRLSSTEGASPGPVPAAALLIVLGEERKARMALTRPSPPLHLLRPQKPWEIFIFFLEFKAILMRDFSHFSDISKL